MSVAGVCHVPSQPAALVLTMDRQLQFAFARKRAAGQCQDVRDQAPQGRLPGKENATSVPSGASKPFAAGYPEQVPGNCWTLDKDSIEAENRNRLESMSVAEVGRVTLLHVGLGGNPLACGL